MTQTDLRPTTDDAAAGPGCACDGPCGSRGRTVTRRTAIGAGVVAGAALMTACGSSDSATPSSTATSTSTSSPSSSSSTSSSATTSSTATSATSESSASSSESSSASSSAAPSGTEVAKVADIPSGGSKVVNNGDAKIVLAKNTDGTVVAHSAVCTHQGCTVNADGAVLACPCHGSTFDAFSGAATKGPASQALETVNVQVSGDAVYVTS